MQWLNLEDHVNLLSLIGAFVIIIATLIVVARLWGQMKVKKTSSELGEHNWDGIGECKNDVPTGWAVVFVLTLVWLIWYFLWGYPLNSHSQIGQYNQEVSAHNAKFEEKFKNLSQEDKVKMGTNLFLVQCSSCHGITADGINGKAQNLNVWGSEEGLVEVITKGSKGLDYPMGEMLAGETLGLSEEDIKAVAAYVAKEVSAIKHTNNEALVEKGRESFAICTTCHGPSGNGRLEENGDLMAPDLTKYGSAEFVVDVLNRGKVGAIGHMPSFSSNILNDIQKQAVGEYVISLSRSE